MADEPVAAEAPEESGTPEEAAVQDAPAQEQTAPDTIDWKQRYEDLRPEADRRQSTLADLEGHNGPQRQAEALRRFGVELQEEEEEEDPYADLADPAEQALQRTEMLEQQLAQRDEAAQEAEFERLESEYIDKTVGELEAKEGIELSEKEYATVVNNALANRLEDDRPDLEGAFADLKEIQSAARDRYLNSKKAPKAPVGTAGEDKLDTKNPEELRKHAAEIMEAEGFGDE